MSRDGTASRKTERLEARMTSQQKTMLLRAAAMQGQTLTEFVLTSAAENARRIVREGEVLELSARDQEAFVDSLLNPPKASPKLRKAALKYRG